MNTNPKTLILVRHAKSSWADPRLPDRERPLNGRGTKDAPKMARRLAKRETRPESIVTSPAVRALATAQAFAAELKIDPSAVGVEPGIYGAGVEDMIEIIRGLDDGLQSVMIVGHNPTLSELSHRLTREEVGDLATCSVVTLRLESTSWGEVGREPLQLVDLDYPKKGKS